MQVALTEVERRQVRMYGVTEAGMREAVESSLMFRHSGPAMMAASIMSDCQEMLSHGNGQVGISGSPEIDFNVSEDIRQALNRAKWILFNYVEELQ
jgi:hypothetical protein